MNNFFTIINMRKTQDIIFSAITIVLGILFCIFSGGIVRVLSILFGISFLVITTLSIMSRFYIFSAFRSRTAMPKLLIQVALALVFILHSDVMEAIYPVVIALMLLFYGLHRLEICYINKEQGLDVVLDMVYSRLAIIIAMAIILIPTTISSVLLGILIGISLILAGALNLAISYLKEKRHEDDKEDTTYYSSENDIIIEVK